MKFNTLLFIVLAFTLLSMATLIRIRVTDDAERKKEGENKKNNTETQKSRVTDDVDAERKRDENKKNNTDAPKFRVTDDVEAERKRADGNAKVNEVVAPAVNSAANNATIVAPPATPATKKF